MEMTAAAAQMKEILDRLGGSAYAGDPVTFLSSPDDRTYEDLTVLVKAILDSLSGNGEKADEAATEGETVKWRCTVCGFEYEGDTIPEDYVCPVCGVGPDKFEKVE